jgi:hypothetical protein
MPRVIGISGACGKAFFLIASRKISYPIDGKRHDRSAMVPFSIAGNPSPRRAMTAWGVGFGFACAVSMKRKPSETNAPTRNVARQKPRKMQQK